MRFAILLIGLAAIEGNDSLTGDSPINSSDSFDHVGTAALDSARPDSCLICHKGGENKLLHDDQRLCFGCHGEIQEKARKMYRHIKVNNSEYPSNDCEGCHRLHRAGARPQLSGQEIELCYSCHRETQQYKSHPVLTFTDEYGSADTIRGSDGKVITCASHCHEIHGADYKYLCRLEPGRELCVSCHEEFR